MSDRVDDAEAETVGDGPSPPQGAEEAGPQTEAGLRIASIELRCRDVEATAAFYASAFGCRTVGARTGRVTLTLGEQRLDLLPSSEPCDVLPAPSNSTAFQHCAIVVSDMDAAMAQLQSSAGWTPISTDGPERLPKRSGGVRAFKFRDPDSHPLEFLQFPADDIPAYWQYRIANGAARTHCLGIDHSAITVADTDNALSFYADLRFTLRNRQINSGPEQARLDAVEDPVVEVASITLGGSDPPHLELLCYRQPPVVSRPVRDDDVLATRVVLLREAADPVGVFDQPGREILDHDGHRVSLQYPPKIETNIG